MNPLLTLRGENMQCSGRGKNLDAKNLETHPQAEQEKRWVALTSVVAAIFLTTMKLVVGLFTGSLGILAEAAHSGLDLVAAVMTLVAVRMSGKPADPQHTYGYGKVENLSALFETVLLLVTCVWIIYEAIQRLFFHSVEIEANLWAFVVMGVSIAIDWGRSRALARAAKKYDSQALEADALHFSTDIWSSAVVIAGLALVRVAGWLGWEWLAKADAIAAMGVAGIVTYVSLQLGRKTIAGLIDAVPAGARDQVMHAVRVPGVLEVRQVRVRRSGPQSFADVTLTVSAETSFERAHEIATQAEAAVYKILPRADIVVHVVPSRAEESGMLATIRGLAARHEVNVHNIRIYDNGSGRRSLDLHLEVGDALPLNQAHAQASAFEETLRQALPSLDHIVTHIEPVGGATAARRLTLADEIRLVQVLQALPQEAGLDCHPHEIMVHRVGGELAVSFHIVVDGDVDIAKAHALTEQVERGLRNQVPDLGRVVIHAEPADANAPEQAD